MSARDALNEIAADMAADVKAFYGKPFDGRTVGELLGNQAAAIARVAQIVGTLLPETRFAQCPRCGRPLPVRADGQLEPHHIPGGPGRMPFCPYRPQDQAGVESMLGYLPVFDAPRTGSADADDARYDDPEVDPPLPSGVEGYHPGDELREHLAEVHKNEAASSLNDIEAQDYHWHEHHTPGGLRDHDMPAHLHDQAVAR